MKHGLILSIVAVAAGLAVLTACGKSGGSNPATSPTGCVYNSSGACVASVGAAGYIGDGNWNGRLIINNLPYFQGFASQNGLCSQYDCNYVSGYVNVQISLSNGGCLPGPGNFAITTYMSGYAGRTLSRRGDAYINSSNNGFLINYISDNGYGGGGYGGMPYPTTQPVGTAGGQGSLQINTTFADATHRIVNVTMVYGGVQIAAGQIYGTATYMGTGVNTAYMCAGSAYGGGGAYGSPYGGGGYPYGQQPGYPYPINTGYVGGGYYGGGVYYMPYGARH
jgi:hypothetical protein